MYVITRRQLKVKHVGVRRRMALIFAGDECVPAIDNNNNTLIILITNSCFLEAFPLV